MSLALPAFAQSAATDVPTVAVPTPVEETAAGQPLLNDEAGDKAKSRLKSVSGVVNVIRKTDRVEVVLRSGEVYALPRGGKQHQIYKALEASEKTGQGVSLQIDERSGVIESVGSGGGKAGGSNKNQ